VLVREADGTTLVLETNRDIGDRKRMEEARALLLVREQAAREEAEKRAAREQAARGEAEAANRAKDDFLAVLSHELRTPLNSMVGWIGLLRAGRLDTARTAHALEVIERNVAQQSRLITDLLDISRIVIGTMRLETTPTRATCWRRCSGSTAARPPRPCRHARGWPWRASSAPTCSCVTSPCPAATASP
jgi:signal transduction histidine kinase